MFSPDLAMPFVSSVFICPAPWTPEAEIRDFVATAEADLRARGVEITQVTRTSVHFRSTVGEALAAGWSRESMASYVFMRLYREDEGAFIRGERDYFGFEREVYEALGARRTRLTA